MVRSDQALKLVGIVFGCIAAIGLGLLLVIFPSWFTDYDGSGTEGGTITCGLIIILAGVSVLGFLFKAFIQECYRKIRRFFIGRRRNRHSSLDDDEKPLQPTTSSGYETITPGGAPPAYDSVNEPSRPILLGYGSDSYDNPSAPPEYVGNPTAPPEIEGNPTAPPEGDAPPDGNPSAPPSAPPNYSSYDQPPSYETVYQVA